jgi:hypothetical protein
MAATESAPWVIAKIDPAADPRWDAYVRAHPRALAWHLAAWNTIFIDEYRWANASLGLWRDGRLAGVLPLVARRGRLSGARLRSLPAAPTAGPIGDDERAEADLLAAAADIARTRGLELSVQSRRQGLETLTAGVRSSDDAPAWIHDVPDDANAWMKSISKRASRGVKRAAKDGVTVRPASGPADVRAFHRLYLEAMRIHHSPPRSLRQVELQEQLMSSDGTFRLFLAERDGEPIAGALWQCFNGTAELLYNGSRRDALDARPNHALYRDIVDVCQELGLTKVDLGYAHPGSPLGEFKAQWGAEPVPGFTYTVGDPGQPASAGGDEATVQRRAVQVEKLLAGAWDRAPLEATAVLGRFVQRWL